MNEKEAGDGGHIKIRFSVLIVIIFAYFRQRFQILEIPNPCFQNDLTIATQMIVRKEGSLVNYFFNDHDLHNLMHNVCFIFYLASNFNFTQNLCEQQ